jgi:ribosomal protein S18 acetylase RimI-like enzyme
MKRVRVYQDLEALPNSYRKLFEINGQVSSFFFSYPWFDNLVRNSLSIAHTMRFFGLEDESDGTAYALAPMCFASTGKRWYKPRKLIAAANYYSSLFHLFQDEVELQAHENINHLIRGIIDDTPQWDCIDLHPIAVDGAQFTSIQQAFRDAGASTQTYFCFGNWYLKVAGRNFQEYFNSVPSRLRNTIDRKSRQLEKSHSLTIKLIQTEAELKRTADAYDQVYQSSWKQSEAHPNFISGLMQTCARHGYLRLGLAYINDQPVAAQLWIVYQGVAYIYKLAYDEQFARLSIGSILTAHMMRHVIDIDHVNEVDYLTGDDDYKKDWMSHRRERWGMIAFNQATLKGKLSGFWHLGRQAIKYGIKTVKSALNNSKKIE